MRLRNFNLMIVVFDEVERREHPVELAGYLLEQRFSASGKPHESAISTVFLRMTVITL
jgi:hypothetical protein